MTQPLSERPYRGKSRSERQTVRRAQLIEAGIELFGTRGFSATGLRDVCYVAHLTERYFYESFDTLADLLDAAVDEIIADATAKAETDNLIEWLIGYLRDEPHRAHICFVEAMAAHPSMRSARTKVLDAMADVYTETSRHTADAADGSLDRELNAFAMAGAAEELVRAWAAEDLTHPAERVARHAELLATESTRVRSNDDD